MSRLVAVAFMNAARRWTRFHARAIIRADSLKNMNVKDVA